MSGPWQLQFVVLERAEGMGKEGKEGLQWARITFLNYYFGINSMKAEWLTEGEREFFYTDDCGRVVRLAFERNDLFGQIFNGNKYRPTTQTVRNRLSKSYFHLNRRAGLFDKVRRYAEVLLSEAKGLFRRTAEVTGLVYDKQRHLLFSLVDVHSRRSNDYSYTKMLTCWSVEDGKLSLQF